MRQKQHKKPTKSHHEGMEEIKVAMRDGQTFLIDTILIHGAVRSNVEIVISNKHIVSYYLLFLLKTFLANAIVFLFM